MKRVIGLITIIATSLAIHFWGGEIAIKYNSPKIMELSLIFNYQVDVSKGMLVRVLSRKKFAPLDDNSRELIDMLLEQGADINEVDNVNQNTSLFIASSKLDVTTVEFLLSRGSSTNYANIAGETPLLAVCKQNGVKAYQIINLLAQYHADFSIKNLDGENCLSLAEAHLKGSKIQYQDHQLIELIKTKTRSINNHE